MNKTNRAFSSLSIDLAHEKNNKIVKGDGGAIGLTESSTQLLRWMVSGPEMSGIITDFEVSQGWWFGGIFSSQDQDFSPFLSSQYGKVRSSINSDLFSYLSQGEWTSASTKVICWNFTVVTCETFQGYRETVFLPYVINQLRNVERLDVVWDRYLPTGLKILHGAREERVSVQASDRTPESQEIGEPPWRLTRKDRNFFFTGRAV